MSAARQVEKALGDKVETTFVENVTEGPDAERVDRAARAHRPQADLHHLVRLHGADRRRSRRNIPNMMFEHATGYKRAKNLAHLFGPLLRRPLHQGQIAAKMSKTGVIGYIGSFPIPEVISGINAMMLGAQSVNPDIKVKIIWVNSWFDPGQGSRRRQGAGRSGRRRPHPAHRLGRPRLQIAEERGIHASARISDMIKFGPKAQLTADHRQLGPYYIERVKLALDGKWTSERHLGRPRIEDGA